MMTLLKKLKDRLFRKSHPYYVEWYDEVDPTFFQSELNRWAKLSEVRALGLRPNDMNCCTREERLQWSRKLSEERRERERVEEKKQRARLANRRTWLCYGLNNVPNRDLARFLKSNRRRRHYV